MPTATTPPTISRKRLAREAFKAGVKAVKSLVQTIDGEGEVSLTDIIAAASAYYEASELSKAGDRDKRRAKKLLDTIPDGFYGAWHIFRKPPTRETPDLEAIRAVYQRFGLGEVPMKKVAPSLAIEPVKDGRA